MWLVGTPDHFLARAPQHVRNATCPQEPAFLDELLAKAAPTASQLRVYRTFLRVRTAAYNVGALFYNWTVGLIAPRLPYASARLPPNGPMLME